jgi:hypothetical protein
MGVQCPPMTEKTGSQVLGVQVELIGDMITRRDALRVLQHKLDITDRQARASVSSYYAQGWPEPRGGINDALARVNSFECAVLDQADRRYEASIANGSLGGRPGEP